MKEHAYTLYHDTRDAYRDPTPSLTPPITSAYYLRQNDCYHFMRLCYC